MKKNFIYCLFCILHLGICMLHPFSLYAGVKEIRYPDGFLVLLREDRRLPIVSVQFWVKTGSSNENDTVSGISHLIEHMLFKGTEKYPGEAIQEEVERRGGVINAGTSRDFTYFYVTLPTRMGTYPGQDTYTQTAHNNLFMGIDILFQMIRKATFPDEELEMEKFVILEEIDRKRDDPQSSLWELFNSVLYQGHPYSRSILGTSSSVRHISKEGILNYYKTFYSLSNCTLVIVGDFKEKDVVSQIKSQILNTKYQVSSVKNQESDVRYKYKEETKAEQNAKLKNLEIEKPVSQVYLMLGAIGPDVTDNDCYSMDIISYILGKGRCSRLYRKLREETRLVWSVNCSFLTQKEKGPFYISIQCDTDRIALVKEILFQELKRISEEPVIEEEIKRAKLLFESEYLQDGETYSGEAFNLGYYQTVGSYKIALCYLNKILKVTSKDIQRTAAKYLNPENFISVMIKPPGGK